MSKYRVKTRGLDRAVREWVHGPWRPAQRLAPWVPTLWSSRINGGHIPWIAPWEPEGLDKGARLPLTSD